MKNILLYHFNHQKHFLADIQVLLHPVQREYALQESEEIIKEK
jgi:hypothetical protein